MMMIICMIAPESLAYLSLPIGTLTVALLLHVPLIPLRGANFVIWDADPNSWEKIYWFISIFISAVFGAAIGSFVT